MLAQACVGAHHVGKGHVTHRHGLAFEPGTFDIYVRTVRQQEGNERRGEARRGKESRRRTGGPSFSDVGLQRAG
eukprot:COSAG06_NODE_105_length_23834_cov_15.256710_10_plen_74_part_00